jgi:hypothetical protein
LRHTAIVIGRPRSPHRRQRIPMCCIAS